MMASERAAHAQALAGKYNPGSQLLVYVSELQLLNMKDPFPAHKDSRRLIDEFLLNELVDTQPFIHSAAKCLACRAPALDCRAGLDGDPCTGKAICLVVS